MKTGKYEAAATSRIIVVAASGIRMSGEERSNEKYGKTDPPVESFLTDDCAMKHAAIPYR